MSAPWLCAAAAAAAWLGLPPGSRNLAAETAAPAIVRADVASSPRRWAWALLAGTGAWLFISGLPGLVAAVVTASAVWFVLGRAETPAERRRRARVRGELPHLVGLMAGAVRGGLPPADALEMVCAALPGPAADRLAQLAPRIALGVDPVEVWCSLDGDVALAPLGRTLARSARTGEPVAEALDRLAAELSARGRAEAEDSARQVGVRAAVPLGLCLLPSFLLLGIVPVVAGLVARLAG